MRDARFPALHAVPPPHCLLNLIYATLFAEALPRNVLSTLLGTAATHPPLNSSTERCAPEKGHLCDRYVVVEGNGREDMGGGVEEVTVRKRKGNMRQRVKRNETVSAPLSGKKTRRGDYINVLLFFFKPQLFR